MAKQKEGVWERILECGKREFLKKGYENASLRSIAAEADTSTSSIYTRFGDKKGLFQAIVSPAKEGLLQWFCRGEEEFHQLSEEDQKAQAYTFGKDKFSEFVDYVYDHYDDFRLLLCCSKESGYVDFIESMVETDMEYTEKFIVCSGSSALSEGRICRELMHMLSSAFYSGLFETVIHGMSRENARKYVMQLRRFYICGWKDMLQI